MDAERARHLQQLGITAWERRPSDAAPEQGLSPPEAINWADLEARVAACRLCGLHSTRTRTVFGVGHRNASLMIVGEAPGQNEDLQGEPFVGRAGQLLNAMLAAIGLGRDDVFITNVLKCRPPSNRDPSVAESEQCRVYLNRQIQLIGPRLLLAVGRIAAQTLLGTTTSIGALRGREHTYAPAGLPLVVTYHPAFLLRSPAEKSRSWQDLKRVRQLLWD